jgi:hypothetical protein
VLLAHPPQCAAKVVLVGDRDHPAVFIDVEDTSAVNVARARFQRRLHDPDAMQLVARVLGIDMACAQHIGSRRLAARDPVRVVGDVEILPGDELPVVAIRRAVVHLEVVVGSEAVCGGAGIVVADCRRRVDATRLRVVAPRASPLRRVIDRLIHEQHPPGEARRPRDRLQHVTEPVVVAVLRQLAEIAVVEVEFVVEVDRRCRRHRA